MDIEERAEKWVRKYSEEVGIEFTVLDMETAYLAGAGQAQSDYVAYIAEEKAKGNL
jgi:hypothetical protein